MVFLMNLHVYNVHVFVCNMIEHRVKICIYLPYFFFPQGFEPMIQAAESGLPVDMSQVVYNTSVYINIYMNKIETCRYVIIYTYIRFDL